MRISIREQNLINEIFMRQGFPIGTELRLFGSRCHDALKGGDLDLLVLLPICVDLKFHQLKKYNFLVDLKDALGEQKIDLLLEDRNQLTSNSFLMNIYTNSLLLKLFE